MLTLFEELFLLSIHEEKGTIINTMAEALPYGISGAILAELALLGKIGIQENHRIEVLDSNPTGDDILDEALEILAASEKNRRFGYWIETLSQKPAKRRKRLAERLIQKGVVSEEDDRLQWVIPFADSLDQYASAKYMMKNRLRALVLASAQVDVREVALLSLVRACGLLDFIFVKDERKLANRHIHELIVGEALKDPAVQTIEEIGAAIVAMVEED